VRFGAADAVDGMVRRITAEWPGKKRPRVVATGGLASIVASISSTIELTDPDLTLRGLRIAAGHVGLAW
jgi:type III pantothenate kinase